MYSTAVPAYIYQSNVRDHEEFFLLPFQNSCRFTLDLENAEQISEDLFVVHI